MWYPTHLSPCSLKLWDFCKSTALILLSMSISRNFPFPTFEYFFIYLCHFTSRVCACLQWKEGTILKFSISLRFWRRIVFWNVYSVRWIFTGAYSRSVCFLCHSWWNSLVVHHQLSMNGYTVLLYSFMWSIFNKPINWRFNSSLRPRTFYTQYKNDQP